MVKEVFIGKKRYIVSNESKVAFTGREWNEARERYRKLLIRKIAG